MSITKEQAVKGINQRLDALKNVKSNEEFFDWTNTTLFFLDSIYGENSIKYRFIEELKHGRWAGLQDCSNDFAGLTKNAESYLEGMLCEIEIFGIQERKEDNSAIQNQINVQQQQKQQQTQNIEQIIEQAIQKLPDDVAEQIRQIMSEGGSKETVFDKLCNATKDVGIGVAASCIATLLMNFCCLNVQQ